MRKAITALEVAITGALLMGLAAYALNGAGLLLRLVL